MSVHNPRVSALYHALHALVIGDYRWHYGAQGQMKDLLSQATVEGVSLAGQMVEAAGRTHIPELKLAFTPPLGFRMQAQCSCGFRKNQVKPGSLCVHVWELARTASQRVELRRWDDLEALRDFLGVDATEETVAFLEALDRAMTTAEAEPEETRKPIAERAKRLVWMLNLRHRTVSPGLQTATRTGWGKARVVRELAPLLTLPATDADRHLLAAVAAGKSSDLLNRYATWAPLMTQENLFDTEGRQLTGATGSLTLQLLAGETGYKLSCPEIDSRQGHRLIGQDVVVIQGESEVIALAASRGQTAALARLERHPLTIPKTLAEAPLVQALAARLGVPPPSETASREESPDSTAHIFIERIASAMQVDFQVRPLAGGSWHPVGQGAPLVSMKDADGTWRHTRRAPAEEHAAARARATDLGLGVDDRDDYAWTLNGTRALDFVAALTERQLTAHWKGTPLTVAQLTADALTVRVQRKRDWLELSGGIQLDGETVALAQVLEAMRNKRGYVALGQDRLVRLHGDLQRRLESLAAASDDGVKAPALAAPLVDDALAGLEGSSGDAAWKTLQERLRTAVAVDDALPAGLKADLRPYQHDGFRWLCRLAAWGAGGVLADDMGLGKTVQAIAMLLRRADLGPQLVVCPTSVESNWQDELARFAPSLRVRLLREDRELLDPSPGEVMIAGYQLIQRSPERLAAITWSSLILDEAQMVKNAAAKRSQVLITLPADWRLALTGTPVENRLGELWSIMNLVTPGLLGSAEAFRERFARPIEADRDQAAATRLRERIRPFVLRRTKGQVLTELPPKTEVVRRVESTPDERKLVEAERARILAELESGKGKDVRGSQRMAILAGLTRLRQLACAPRLILPEAPVESSKLTALADLVNELRSENHKMLVFSQFTSFLDLVEEHWRSLDTGVTWLRLDGSTPPAARKGLVKRFQGGETEVFLLSLKAGGTGLNLTAASYVIHCDPWWNPAAEDQASDRAHRMGQDNPVTIVRLVTAGSVEERILVMHSDKRDLIDAVLAGADQAAKLNEAELLGLLRSG